MFPHPEFHERQRHLILRHPLFLAVYLPSALISVCQGMMIPVLPIFTRTFDASYGVVGLVLAAEGVGQIIGNLPVGTLLRRFGRNNTMRLGVVIVVSMVLALYWSQTVLEVVCLRFLTGVGHAIWNVSRVAYLAEETVSQGRGRAIALFGGVSRMGSFIGPGVGGLVAAAWGIRAPFIAYALIAVVVLVIVLVGLGPEKRGVETTNKKSFRMWDIFKEHRSILAKAGTGQLLAQTVRSGRAVIVPLYAADVIGLGVDQIGFVLSAASFVDMSLFYPAGMIMDRFGRKFAIVPSFLLQALGLAAVPFTGGFISLTAAVCVIGIGNGLSSGSMMTLGADLAPPEDVGDFLGVWRLIGDGGRMGSPVIVGGISDIVGLQPAALVIACAGLCSSAVFAFFVPETLEKAPAD